MAYHFCQLFSISESKKENISITQEAWENPAVLIMQRDASAVNYLGRVLQRAEMKDKVILAV